MQADLSAAPTIREGDRLKAARWLVESTDDGDVFVELSCHHNAGNKTFGALLSNITVGQDRGFTTTRFAPFSSVRLYAKPVARYSAKALAEFYDDAVSALRDAADSETVTAFRRGEHAI